MQIGAGGKTDLAIAGAYPNIDEKVSTSPEIHTYFGELLFAEKVLMRPGYTNIQVKQPHSSAKRNRSLETTKKPTLNCYQSTYQDYVWIEDKSTMLSKPTWLHRAKTERPWGDPIRPEQSLLSNRCLVGENLNKKDSPEPKSFLINHSFEGLEGETLLEGVEQIRKGLEENVRRKLLLVTAAGHLIAIFLLIGWKEKLFFIDNRDFMEKLAIDVVVAVDYSSDLGVQVEFKVHPKGYGVWPMVNGGQSSFLGLWWAWPRAP
ncbi:hypothetical protein BY996DRAFT_6554596 [Phakopsora pachyrhizi]|nr:hypothetical protein BY996DRAFT_6554596 [Phakopsora pachyrhizi]